MVQAYAHELLNQKEAENGFGAPYASNTLFSATEKLLNALERLEYNLRAQAGKRSHDVRDAEQIMFFEQENRALRQEREKLNASLDQLEQEYNDLQQVAGTIYRKLNDSIKRLSSIIGD